MPDVIWRPLAREEFLSAIAYLTNLNSIAAQELHDRIWEKVQALPERPRAYRSGRVKGTREMIVHPNYIVVYTETPEQITILRVLHAARHWP